MFVSRKNLPFIHLVPTEATPGLYMFQSLHQSVELLRAAASCCELLQPFAEQSIERLVLRFGQQARLLNQLLICTEGNVFHTKTVYTIFVQRASAHLWALRSGMVYFCAWGPGCERFHDIVDEVVVEDQMGERIFVGNNESDTIMTTWHDDEPLHEVSIFSPT